jgi:hypothetical protein
VPGSRFWGLDCLGHWSILSLNPCGFIPRGLPRIRHTGEGRYPVKTIMHDKAVSGTTIGWANRSLIAASKPPALQPFSFLIGMA